MRFDFIERVCEQTVVKPKESKEHVRSEKIDKILTGKYTAIPCFVGIMVLVFYLTFNVIGAFLQGICWKWELISCQEFVDRMTSANVNDVMHSLVIDGIFKEWEACLVFFRLLLHCFSSFLCWKTVDIWREWHL